MLASKRDALVLEHLPLAKAIAFDVGARISAVPFDDLVAAAINGLMAAAGRFSEEMGVKFSAYAKHRIRGSVIDYVRTLDHLSREARDFSKRVDAAELAIRGRGESVDDESIARELKCSLAKLRDFRATANPYGEKFPSLDDPDFGRLASIRDTADHPERKAVKDALKFELARAISMLPERDQTVMHLYFYGELTMKETGAVIGVNESRVSQIIKESLRLCREELPGWTMLDFCELVA